MTYKERQCNFVGSPHWNGSSSGSASQPARTQGARLRENRWNGSSNESGGSREGQTASVLRRQWKSWLGICAAGTNYFSFCETSEELTALTRWVR